MSKLELSLSSTLSIDEFIEVIYGDKIITVSHDSIQKLTECRSFIDNLLVSNDKVYGVTTGVGDLRNINIPPHFACDFSTNLIRSHDAGIGEPFSEEITLGAMIVCANSLSKGLSGFSPESLNTLIEMINAKIIPEIPSSGSLGASGDLAFLARLGRAMMGDNVPVLYQGQKVTANEALRIEKIAPFRPKAKEGLALINGTAFMTSMLTLSFHNEIKLLDNLIAFQGLFLNASGAIESAFYQEVHKARNQDGQKYIANILLGLLKNSNTKYEAETQNDYCIRCIPQIFGPRIEAIFEQRRKIEAELNAVTDNPLIFKQLDNFEEHHPRFIKEFNNEKWGVFSGGNFHGENLTIMADTIALSNAKIAITLERQMAYLLNPTRNSNRLPCYLIPKSDNLGIKSGFMIPHYTANALVHKMNLLAQPSSLMNATSSNESEDVVSYGATACEKLRRQQEHFLELLAIYGLTVAQAYSLIKEKNTSNPESIEKLYNVFENYLKFPIGCENGFSEKYESAKEIIQSGKLEDLINKPIFHKVYNLNSLKKELKYVDC